jgi:hypothetical protein
MPSRERGPARQTLTMNYRAPPARRLYARAFLGGALRSSDAPHRAPSASRCGHPTRAASRPCDPRAVRTLLSCLRAAPFLAKIVARARTRFSRTEPALSAHTKKALRARTVHEHDFCARNPRLSRTKALRARTRFQNANPTSAAALGPVTQGGTSCNQFVHEHDFKTRTGPSGQPAPPWPTETGSRTGRAAVGSMFVASRERDFLVIEPRGVVLERERCGSSVGSGSALGQRRCS